MPSSLLFIKLIYSSMIEEQILRLIYVYIIYHSMTGLYHDHNQYCIHCRTIGTFFHYKARHCKAFILMTKYLQYKRGYCDERQTIGLGKHIDGNKRSVGVLGKTHCRRNYVLIKKELPMKS